MFDLVIFELKKIWKKTVFLTALLSLLLTNVFMLWYTNQPQEFQPALSAYREFQNDIFAMDEMEKEEYIQKLYDDIQGIRVVNEILNCKNLPDEIGEQTAQQIMHDHEGVYEQYLIRFQEGSYLRYTNSLDKEIAFIEEMYRESQQVFRYSVYKKEIAEQKNILDQVSVFSQDEESFSSRNIRKTANDYANINPDHLVFAPSKGLIKVTNDSITDFLMILIVILFACYLVFDEKETNLFYVTKATKYGGIPYIGAKLAALGIHCLATVFCFGLCNYLFYELTCGVGNLFCSIQSFALFVESTLSITAFNYLILAFFTKIAVLFAIGITILFIAIKTKHIYVPYLIIGSILLIQITCYLWIPPQSVFQWLKYMNLFAFLNVHDLFGSYLNLNAMGYPITRLSSSVTVFLMIDMIGLICVLFAFVNMKHFEISRWNQIKCIRFKPHSSLFRHELYKTFIINKAFVILMIFTCFIGYYHFEKDYRLSSSEQYYQNLLLTLEGTLTPEKEKLIHDEKKRFDEAFQQMEQIDAMESTGKIDHATAESMKMDLYRDTYFYSSFEPIYNQYQKVKGSQGCFIYETGYALLSGVYDNNTIFEYMFITIGAILMFHSMFAFEYQKKSWFLISSTVKGRKTIIKNKLLITAFSIGIISIVSFLAKYIAICKVCPMNEMLSSTTNLSFFAGVDIDIPIILWLIGIILTESLVCFAISIIILMISDYLKRQLATLFFANFILVSPLVLYLSGLSWFKWLTFFPLFNLTVDVMLTQSFVCGCFYLIVAWFILFMGIRYLLKEERRN